MGVGVSVGVGVRVGMARVGARARCLHAAPYERAQPWRVRLRDLEDELVVHLVSMQ